MARSIPLQGRHRSDRADRAQVSPGTILGACCTLVGLVALVLTWRFPGLVLLFALLFAIGYSATPTVGGAASADIFLGRNFGSIFGAMGLAIGIGSAIGPWVAGYVFDSTGSYLVAFGVAAVCTASAAGCMWLAGPRRVRRVTRGPGGALGN